MSRPIRPRGRAMSRCDSAARGSMWPTPPEEGGSGGRPSGGGKFFGGRSQKPTSRGILPWWEKLLYLFVAAIVATVWWSRVGPQHSVVSFPPATAAPAPQMKVPPLPPPGAEEPPQRPSVPLRGWPVLFNFPTPGQTEVSRRTKIQIFFNRPVEREVTEGGLPIFPSPPGDSP